MIAEVSEAIGDATNNVAEYKSLVSGLAAALDQKVTEIEVFMDSELVVKQIRGEYRVKNAGLKPIWEEARALAEQIPSFSIAHVRRERNKEADALVNRALDAATT